MPNGDGARPHWCRSPPPLCSRGQRRSYISGHEAGRRPTRRRARLGLGTASSGQPSHPQNLRKEDPSRLFPPRFPAHPSRPVTPPARRAASALRAANPLRRRHPGTVFALLWSREPPPPPTLSRPARRCQPARMEEPHRLTPFTLLRHLHPLPTRRRAGRLPTPNAAAAPNNLFLNSGYIILS